MKLTIGLLLAGSILAVSILTGHYGLTRNAVNSSEITLTPANVGKVKKLGAYAVDGAVYAQPLYVS